MNNLPEISLKKCNVIRSICLLLFVFYLIVAFLRIFVVKNVYPFAIYDYPWQFHVFSKNYIGRVVRCINLLPFTSIVHWIKAYFNETINTNIICYNLFTPILAAIPFGFFHYAISKNRCFSKSLLMFIVIISIVFVVRLLITIGYYDIDKVILCSIGYSFGYACAKTVHCVFKKISARF